MSGFTFDFLLEDLKKRGMGINFGKDNEAKEKALSFKKYAKKHDVVVHVILDERKIWSIVTDKTFQYVNEQWRKIGKAEQISY